MSSERADNIEPSTELTPVLDVVPNLEAVEPHTDVNAFLNMKDLAVNASVSESLQKFNMSSEEKEQFFNEINKVENKNVDHSDDNNRVHVSEDKISMLKGAKSSEEILAILNGEVAPAEPQLTNEAPDVNADATSAPEVKKQTVAEFTASFLNKPCEAFARFSAQRILEGDSPFDLDSLRTPFYKQYMELFGTVPPDGFFYDEISKRCKKESPRRWAAYGNDEREDDHEDDDHEDDCYGVSRRPQPDDHYQ
jgi:hypothetical protein